MPRGVRNVQVPGQAAQAEPQAPKGSTENPLADADAAADLAGKPRPSDPPDDESLEQKVARLEAENAQLKATTAAIRPDEPEVPETDSDAAYRDRARTLRAKDVDPSKLKRAVLTADGWVCPEKSPAPVAKE